MINKLYISRQSLEQDMICELFDKAYAIFTDENMYIMFSSFILTRSIDMSMMVVTYNGKLFNRVELRLRKLKKTG